MASPLRILTIGSEKIRADKVAYVLDDNTIRRVFYEGVFITTTDSIATLQALIPELITLNYTEGGNVYVNAVGVTSIQDIVNETLIRLNTIASVTVLDSVSDVTTAINLKLATGGGAINGSISINQVAYGIGSDTIGGESTFTYNSTDDVLTTEGHLLTPQATNPETTNPNDNLWINSGDNHLYRGDRDVESVVHFNVRNDEGATIPVGAPLYSKGEIGGSNRIKVGIADASDANKMPCIGVAMEEMNTTSTKDGNAIASGILNENLTGFTGLTDNTVIYVTAHGGTWSTVSDLLSPTKPTGTTHLIQNVGVCIRHTGGTTMKGFNVAAIGRTNDTPNQISIPGNITAASFVTSGGTATQYVRGDGSATELEISQDLSPQLGAALDTQGYAITGNYATDSRRAILIESGTNRTLSSTDSGDFLITTSSSPTTLVIPESATADFTLGTEIEIAQKGAGAVTVSAATNVTLNASATGAVTVPNQWGGASLKKIDANEWLLIKKGSTGGGGGGGVDTFNTLTGDVTISEGTNITFNTVGNDIEISASGGGGGGTVTEVTTNAPLSVASGTSTPDLSITQATTSTDGYLTSTNWNTFNNKLSSVGGDAAPILGGDLDVNGNSIVSSGGGDISITPSGPGNVITSNVTIDGIKYPQTDGTGGQVLQTNGAGELSFATVSGGGGSGDVVGPSSATDNAIARFDTTTGKLLQNSSATIDDAGAITAPDFIGDLNGAVRFDAKAIGSAIDKGEVVYISGISGNTPEIQLAQSNSSATMPAFGIALADIAENNTGEVATFGSVKGLDVTDFGETSIIFSVGDTVYVSSTEAGKLTNVPPSGEANLIQNIGKIERATPTSNMTIKVGGAGRTNATPNLDSAKMFLGNSSNQSVSVAMSGDVTISNTGATTVGTINSVAVATVTAGAALGATAQQPPSEGAFVNGDKTKLDGIEALADVTDATNVTAAGALMDSEVTNLADVKAFATTDYATAAQGLTADAALPKAGGAMTGAITGNQDITGKRPIVTDTTTNIDLTLGTHEGTFIYSDNVAAVAVNIPPNSTQAFPVGTEIDMIQAGGGQVTVAPGTGVNLNGGIATIAITAQWGGATLKQITVDNWIIVGKI